MGLFLALGASTRNARAAADGGAAGCFIPALLTLADPAAAIERALLHCV